MARGKAIKRKALMKDLKVTEEKAKDVKGGLSWPRPVTIAGMPKPPDELL